MASVPSQWYTPIYTLSIIIYFDMKIKFLILIILFSGKVLSAEIPSQNIQNTPSERSIGSYSLEDLFLLKVPMTKSNVMQSFIPIGILYYISRYPKIYGIYMGMELLLSPTTIQDGGELYSYNPVFIYNFFLLPSDVGDEGRFRVFATNIGLMVAGHYTYEWFIKDKSPTPKNPNALTWTPLLSTEFQGVMVSRRF